jgi:hypothetical protein
MTFEEFRWKLRTMKFRIRVELNNIVNPPESI